jgi:hypothetical protein
MLFKLRREGWVHETSLTPPFFFFIKVPVSSQEGARPCICVLAVSILPLSMIFRTVPKVSFFLHFLARPT